jgi:hypothetical protein
MMVIATFRISEAGIPAIAEMSLMPVTQQWLPIEDSFERPDILKAVHGVRNRPRWTATR